MGVAISIVLIAAGAILTWAVTAEAEGIDVNTVGVILLIVGLLGLVLSLIFWSSWGGFQQRRTTYVDDRQAYPPAAPRRRTTVVEDDDVAPGPPGPPVP